jgi:hypothetical protein
MFFSNNNSDNEFIQCMPDYPKQEGFFKSLFGGKRSADNDIVAYIVEAGTGEKIYTTKVSDKTQVKQIFNDYYVSRRLPDISGWQDTGII